MVEMNGARFAPPFSQFEGSFYNDSLGIETLIIS